jgi:hypothetical protein
MDALPPLTNRQSGGSVFTHGSLPDSGYFFEEQLLRRNSAHFRLPSGFHRLVTSSACRTAGHFRETAVRRRRWTGQAFQIRRLMGQTGILFLPGGDPGSFGGGPGPENSAPGPRTAALVRDSAAPGSFFAAPISPGAVPILQVSAPAPQSAFPGSKKAAPALQTSLVFSKAPRSRSGKTHF